MLQYATPGPTEPFIMPFPLDATAQRLRQGSLDLCDYINTVCDRIDAQEPQILALLPEPNRRTRLLAEAEALQAHYPVPDSRPPLFGVLVGVKDIFRADGFPTKAGSHLPEELFAGQEAVTVTQLKQAGALILGKTVTTEFAYFCPGPTRNPYNLEHTPGGSSSGSAAAVAAGFCQLAVGTQTIGSVIRPASFCGVIGFKPSYDRISTAGVVPLSPSLDHVGFFTQDIEGAALTASMLCKNWKIQANIPRPKAVLGIPEGKYLEQAEPETLAVFAEIVKSLEHADYIVKHINVLNTIDAINQSHRRMMAAEMAHVHAQWFAEYRELYSTQSTELILTGQQVRQSETETAKAGQIALRTEIEAMMRTQSIDLWIAPSAPTDAPKGLQATGNPIMNFPWTYAGLPTISLPVAVSNNGLPLGLQLITAFDEDELLMQWAADIQPVFV